LGLTQQSTGLGVLKDSLPSEAKSAGDLIIALAGNPNTGKSTVFNSLTGLNQHTGNWPGKTVTNARGKYSHQGKDFTLVDLPGTYSLFANSAEEEIARDFICFGQPHATVVVTDATCLERNLNLVLQVMEITDKVVVCVNLADEAKRKNLNINFALLSEALGVPVVETSARDGTGLTELKDAVYRVATGQARTKPLRITYDSDVEQAVGSVLPLVEQTVAGKINPRWAALRLIDNDASLLNALNRFVGIDIKASPNLNAKLVLVQEELRAANIRPDEIRDRIVSRLVKRAEAIAGKTVFVGNKHYNNFDRKLDNIVTSRHWGIPIMLGLLGLVFWITIKGANFPSEVIANGLFRLEEHLTALFQAYHWPDWLHGILVLGMYRTLAWVISVMLPPMAIFFPLFTLLEDLGYLPRVAFNLDNFFKKACAHGKQALTMCMGFGCNAAGIIACRIIDSPRERLIAMLTNNFVPCNGRFPTLIALASIFIAAAAGPFRSAAAALTILGVIVLGVLITLAISSLLSRTVLKGLPSSFTLELPPYRKPQLGRIIVRSILDRTLFVLGRAITVAAPAGLIVWLMDNVTSGSTSLLGHCAAFLHPFASWLGLDGYILTAFILGFPANEIVLPILIMSYLSTGSMLELDSLTALRELLVANGWTWLTAVCTMLFSLNHFPCGTTILTIHKETRSAKWTLLSFLVPTIVGVLLCFIVAQSARLLGLA